MRKRIRGGGWFSGELQEGATSHPEILIFAGRTEGGGLLCTIRRFHEIQVVVAKATLLSFGGADGIGLETFLTVEHGIVEYDDGVERNAIMLQ
jgi:hypothetical protein